jgi:hypothetical protein
MDYIGVQLPSTAAVGCRLSLVALACLCASAQAQQAPPADWRSLGVASLGATGGLTTPGADVLDSGLVALSAGNYQDPHFGKFGQHKNFALGFGLWPGLELFGRFTDYTDPQHARPGTRDEIGVRDLSVNLKWQLPIQLPMLPKLAIGVTDLAGGAQNFRSFYGVAGDSIGPLSWTLGLARGTASRQQEGAPRVLDGVFGGAELRLPGTGASALADSDGTQRHLGLRYATNSIAELGHGHLVATVQRSFGAKDWFNREADGPSASLQWVMPMASTERQRQTLAAPLAQARPLRPLTAADAGAGSGADMAGAAAAARDWSAALVRVLRQAGLDRVRAGLQGQVLVVAYENRSFLRNEVDALGLVLGVAAELAPGSALRVQAVALKSGAPISATTVNLLDFRRFLRDGDGSAVRAGLVVEHGPQALFDQTVWSAGSADDVRAPIQLELKPLLSYTLGTELAAFDYALAANLRMSASPWRGALVYADWVQRLANSANMDPGKVFEAQRQQNGLATLALQQSLWLHPALFASGGVGIYRHDYAGVEAELVGWVPGRDDTVHLKGMALRRYQDRAALPSTQAFAGSYRWQWRPDTWVEGTVQRYTDGSTGPALAITRWFGDVAVNLRALRGGSKTFAGIELSLPLTPRQASRVGPVLLTGAQRYVQNYRMRVAARDTRGHLESSAVRPVDLTLRPEAELLNAGRVSGDYVASQMQRMREAFYLYGRNGLDDGTRVATMGRPGAADPGR